MLLTRQSDTVSIRSIRYTAYFNSICVCVCCVWITVFSGNVCEMMMEWQKSLIRILDPCNWSLSLTTEPPPSQKKKTHTKSFKSFYPLYLQRSSWIPYEFLSLCWTVLFLCNLNTKEMHVNDELSMLNVRHEQRVSKERESK